MMYLMFRDAISLLSTVDYLLPAATSVSKVVINQVTFHQNNIDKS